MKELLRHLELPSSSRQTESYNGNISVDYESVVIQVPVACVIVSVLCGWEEGGGGGRKGRAGSGREHRGRESD